MIYTPENPEANTVDAALLKDIAPDTEVIKTKIWEPYSFYKVLFGGKKNTSDGGKHIKANIIGSENKSFTHKLSLFVRGNFFIPDPRCWWIRPSIKFLVKYLKEHPVDVIVSTGPPHSMHLIAKGVSKATGIRWIADFRDPWTEIFYFKHLNLSKWAFRKHRKLEQSVLDSADTVVVVSKKMQADFAARTSTPVEVITNGFDHEDFLNPAADVQMQIKPDVAESCFSLVHTGIFVDIGNPEHLWEVLGEKAAAEPQFKKNLQIRLMGQVDDSILQGIEKAGLEGNLHNMGYRPHNEVVQWQQQAQVLLLPLRKEPEAAAILTGKFFEYLASGREILAFGPTYGDLAKALQETGSGTIVEFEDKEAVRREIDRLYEKFLKEKNAPEGSCAEQAGNHREGKILSPAVMKYSRKYLAGEMVKLFEK
ncbi:MAG: glycosyltransferase [Bacteroidales bacterium]|nr:glycosyltransferase [Bacteroidales bacterium]